LDIALEILPQVLLDGIVLGFMYALIALGYTMVYGVLEFINFAHSEIFVLGAFVGVEVLLLLQSAGLLATLPPALILLLEPVLSPIWAWLAFGEAPGALALAGGAVILIATALHARRTRQ
jgi:branched-chain amino acid transport system permease protein